MSDAVFKQANLIRPVKVYPNPKSGTYYTAASGSDLYSVSIIAYGYDKTSLIISANTILQSRPLDQGTSLPIIYQDDNIWLPREPGLS